MNRLLALWIPNWPIQRLVSKQPELAGRSVVLEVATHRGRHVAACSDAAREQGIEVGMTITEAKSLSNKNLSSMNGEGRGGRRSSLYQQPYDPTGDRQSLEKLAAWLHRFSPSVGIESSETPDTLLLDATNLAPLFGGEAAFAEQVARGVARLRLTTQLALADTLGAAWAVSHFTAARGLANITLIPTGETQTAITPLPLAALRLPIAMQETLQHLGIERVDELLALPRDQLEPRFGPLLLERIDQALGDVAEVVESVTPPLDFTAEWLPEHPLSSLAQTEKAVERLVRQIAERLSAQGAGALQVVCRFAFENAAPVTMEVGLFRPTDNAKHLLEIIGMQLERLLLPGPVTSIGVQVARHAPLERRQQVLFGDESFGDESFGSGRSLANSSPLASLVDRLAGRLGTGAVVECRLGSDAQPELAYREEPLVGGAKRRRRRSGKLSALSPVDRPLQLLAKPAPLRTMTTATSGSPLCFQTAGREHHIARHWGPERIETGWWRGRGVRRDYYRVETNEGRRFWIFQRRNDDQWFLHGTFE